MATQVVPLKVGETLEPEARIFHLGDPVKEVRLNNFFWFIRHGEKKILVDTGFDAGYAKKYDPGLTPAKPPLQQLQELGVDPLDIDAVILTHVHWDHLSPTIDAFANSEIVLQRREVQTVLDPPHPWFRRFIDVPTLERVLGVHQSRVRLVDGSDVIVPGIEVFLTPGHTLGHQSVLIRGERTTAVIAGDVGITYRNFEEDIAVGFNCDLAACYRSMEKIRRVADLYFAGHEPLNLTRHGNPVDL